MEIKLLLVFFYYLILGSEALIAFVLNAKGIGPFAAAVAKYFACEAAGYVAGETCNNEKKAYESLNNVGISVLSYLLLGLLPVASLVFVVNLREVKQYCISCTKKMLLQKILGTCIEVVWCLKKKISCIVLLFLNHAY